MKATGTEIGWVRGKLLMDMRFIQKIVGKDQKTSVEILRYHPSDDPGFGELFLRGRFIDVPESHRHLVDTTAVPQPQWVMPPDKEQTEDKQEGRAGMEDKQTDPGKGRRRPGRPRKNIA